MQLILVLSIVVLFTLCTENKANDDFQWKFRRPRYNRDWTNDFVERFPGRRGERKLKKKYSRLIMDRQMFYYWDHNYSGWTNWTACSPVNCTKSRFRKCKDLSWEQRVTDFRKQKKCPVQFVYEKKICNDTPICVKKNTEKQANLSTNTLPEACGEKPSEIENRIYGGDESQVNSWPWHVGLYVNTQHRSIYICGGTLINPGWVVTAAHCLKTVDKVGLVPLGEIIDTRKYDFFDNFEVVIGDHDRSRKDANEVTRKISHFIIHQSFKVDYSSNLYDVALLKLDEIVPKKKNIDFACVPKSKNYTLAPPQKCFAIGWGNMKSQDPYNIWSFEFDWYLDRWRQNQKTKNAYLLQEVEIPLVDFKKCQKKYRIFNLKKDIHICAGSMSKDTCRGDSGGGLFCQDPINHRWQLYGITNFGSARGCGKSYGVYIRVAELAGWIRDIIKKHNL